MNKRKILIVDDDEAVLDFLQAKIGARYDLVATNAPENVLKLAREHQPQLILCDVDMPEMDGGDLSSALFADDELRDIPVLFLTALATPQDLKRLAGQLGGRPAVSKSEPIAKLVERIEALIPH
ncbi:MAG TPA: response regulator [Burkholderiales bacterium]|jgi:CheY-like chemotaxis protein